MPGKSFMVVDGPLRLKITPDSGWYCVEGLDIKGLTTQGRTIEEAIYMAHDAAQALAEARAIMAAKKAAKAEKLPPSKRKKPALQKVRPKATR
jgi:Uncharacterised protein family (UPF0150).